MFPTVDLSELMAAAATGDESAWHHIVDTYLPLVRHITRRFRLSDREAEDVSQTIWLRLVEKIDTIREPRALPGWIVTTTRNESLRVLRVRRNAGDPVDPASYGALDLGHDGVGVDEALLRVERQQAVLDGLAELPPAQSRLLQLLVADPPFSYEEIGRMMNMPVGSIGPTRARALAKLRATDSIQRLVE